MKTGNIKADPLLIVLDIDGTLTTVISDSDLTNQQNAYFQHIQKELPDRLIPISINNQIYPHLIHHGVLEFIQYLIVHTPHKLAFFSSGVSQRNEVFAVELLRRSFPESYFEQLADKIPVFSRHHCFNMESASNNGYEYRPIYREFSLLGNAGSGKEFVKNSGM